MGHVRHPAGTLGEVEFHQVVVVSSVWPVLERKPANAEANILEWMVEPKRVNSFRVPWVDDTGEIQGQPGLPHRDDQRDRPGQARPTVPVEVIPLS